MSNTIDYETYQGTVKKWTGPEIANALGQIMDPLSKPTYGWPLGRNVLEAKPGSWQADAADQVIRLMGSASIRLDTPAGMAVDLGKISGLVGGDAPPIVVNYSPLKHATCALVQYGSEYWGEVEEFIGRIARLKREGANVVAILLDHEHYTADEPTIAVAGIEIPKPEASILREKLANFYRPAKSMFPESNVSFYNAGGVHPASTTDGTGWQVFPKFPHGGLTDSLGCSLYYPAEYHRCLETVRRTLVGQDGTGTPAMGLIPAVSLASTWVDLHVNPDQDTDLMDQKKMKPESRVWVNGVDCPRTASWDLGLMLYNPWCNKADQIGRYIATQVYTRGNESIDGVWFWPEPMDPMMELEWLVHFRAFVLGSQADKRSEL